MTTMVPIKRASNRHVKVLLSFQFSVKKAKKPKFLSELVKSPIFKVFFLVILEASDDQSDGMGYGLFLSKDFCRSLLRMVCV